MSDSNNYLCEPGTQVKGNEDLLNSLDTRVCTYLGLKLLLVAGPFSYTHKRKELKWLHVTGKSKKAPVLVHLINHCFINHKQSTLSS